MAVYQYQGSIKEREELVEGGTIVAKSEEEARNKLANRHYHALHFKRLTGLKALVGRLKSG